MISILNQIDDVMKCPRCNLSLSRTNVVVGDGLLDAKIMLIGEAPGRNEDMQGKPFVGAAGKLLDKMLEQGKIDRNEVYITNIVKCRPPNNRVPSRQEADACNPYLKKQIEIIDPRIVVLLGKTAGEYFLERKISLGEEHGKLIEYGGRTVMITYHPAAMIYNRKLMDTIFDDFKSLSVALHRA